jgi:molecular chaperone DnaJ
MKDLYKTLGVPEGADADTLKKAYRKLAKEYHPDATGGDKRKTERFKEINEAYAVLSDQQKRREYDRLRAAPVGADGMPEGFDPSTFAQAFGGGGGGMGGFGDINDIFASMFGMGAGPFTRARGGRAHSRGADMETNVEISFKDAALGGRHTLRSGGGTSVEVNIRPTRRSLPGHRGAARSSPTPKR